MYFDHFGLTCPPFKIPPDSRLFFRGGRRGAVLDALVYAIASGEGIIKVVGEVGSGKTMLCRILQSRLPAHVDSVYIANPSLSPENILQVIACELRLAAHEISRLRAMQLLQARLLEQHALGRQMVVFIEEAQSMPLATLEEVRLLSNLETDRGKLLQIVLFGQPELDARLAHHAIRQLRERIVHSFALAPLNAEDVRAYLNFRLRCAGHRGPVLFKRRTARLVTRYSRGLVRRVNIIADKALLAAFAQGTRSISRRHVMRAARDSAFCLPPELRSGCALAVLLLIGPVCTPLAPSQVPDTAIARTVPAAQPLSARAPKGYKLETWMDAARVWLRRAPPHHFSIQLLTVARNRGARLQRDLHGFGGQIALEKVYVYATEVDRRPALTVLYNDYATRADALAAIAALPAALHRNRPFVRAIGDVREQIEG